METDICFYKGRTANTVVVLLMLPAWVCPSSHPRCLERGAGEEGAGHLLVPLGTVARSLGPLQAAAFPEAAPFSSSLMGSVSGLLLLRMQTLMG